MDTPIKQRLIGLSVLIALAAIFLPMLLDGSGREGHVRVDMEIPPEPVFPVPERLPVLPATPEPAARTAPAEPSAVEEPAATPAPRREGVVRAVPESEPAPAPAAEPAAPAAKEPAAPAAAEPGFAVQVGSFSEEARARSLRDSLRTAGFEAFIEPFSSADGRVYRVKVGPVSERDAAVALAARIETSQGLKGLVVSQP